MTTDRVEKLYDDVFPGIEVYDDIGSFVGNWLMPAKEPRELLVPKREDREVV